MDDMDYEERPIRELSVESAERFTWYDGWKSVFLLGYDENGWTWEIKPEEVRKTIFLTEEEAEAALGKMKKREQKIKVGFYHFGLSNCEK